MQENKQFKTPFLFDKNSLRFKINKQVCFCASRKNKNSQAVRLEG